MTQLVIFAGGLGTRLSELTGTIPKPMVRIGPLPIVHHIMNIYATQGVNEFILALGYKQEEFKKYFLDLLSLNGDIQIDFSAQNYTRLSLKKHNFNVKLIDTGVSSLTGRRLNLLKEHINQELFHITYGDGISDVSIAEVEALHINRKSILTITAVHPPARFGELTVDVGGQVSSFVEKPQLNQGWINGGFMVASNKIFKYLSDKDEMFEQGPMQRIMSDNLMSAYKHEGFWQCMDSKKDYDRLNDLYEKKKFIWSHEFSNDDLVI